MSLYERVPQIDLAPEYSGRPLSALRPGDYLRLLWDLFYFPQKVRYYVNAFAFKQRGESQRPHSFSSNAWRGWAEASPVQVQFLFMVAMLCIAGIFLAVNLASFVTSTLAGTTFAYDSTGVAILVGLATSLFMLGLGVIFKVPGTLAVFSLPIGLAFAMYFLSFEIAPVYGLDDGLLALLLLCFFSGIAFGLASAGFFAAESTGWNNIAMQASIGAGIGIMIAVTVGYTGWRDSMAGDTASLSTALSEIILIGLAAFVGFLLAALRVDDFLLHGRYPGRQPHSAAAWNRMPRATSIPLPHLHDHLTAWLDFDWKLGMDNAASLWWYTAQQETVRRALHEILRGDAAQTSTAPTDPTTEGKGTTSNADKQFSIIGRIADAPGDYPWDMVTYDNPARSAIVWSAGRRQKSARSAPGYTQRRIKRQQLRQRALNQTPPVPLPEKTPDQALVAGFWYLDKGYIANASTAFKRGPDLPAVKEMQSIVDALNTLSSEENLLANPSLKLPERPSDAKRKETWEALDKLRTIVRYARIARQSTEEKQEHAAAEARRLLAELASNRSSNRVELRQIRRLAELWEADLDESLTPSTTPNELKPIDNPFIFAEPLRKKAMFVDRGAELAQLKAAWAADNLQPVILFGQPLIGKTSLLYAAANANSHVELAWFHLGHSNRERAGIRQILAAVCAAVQQATVLEVFSFAPAKSALVPSIENASDPYADTERLIRQVTSLLAPRNLILVMDDFDAMAQLFASQAELSHFLDFLEHLFQTIKTFNVVFVSQYSPVLFEEGARHNFASTARQHQLGPLEKKHIASLLRPADFPLFFSDAAVDAVARLSGGHPYLAQMIAYYAVQRFNRMAAQQKGEPLIDYTDILEVLNEPEVEQRAHILFQRMETLARRAGGRAYPVLDAIYQASDGMTREELTERIGSAIARDPAALETMLFRLKRYDMIEEDNEGRWRLRNELWRKWEEGRLALPAPTDDEVIVEGRSVTEDEGHPRALVEANDALSMEGAQTLEGSDTQSTVDADTEVDADEVVAFGPDTPPTHTFPHEELDIEDALPPAKGRTT